MNFSLRSLRLSLLPLVAALGFGTTGCLVEADGTLVALDPGPISTIAAVAIDTDASMSTTPGEGTGLFVETTSDGHWTIYTACDTSLSSTSCSFDVLISAIDARGTLSNVVGQDLSSSDRLALQSDGSIHLVTDTTFDLNGVQFDAAPGAIIEVDLLLDGVSQPAFISWVDGGLFQQGAPSNPVDFAPAF